MAHFAKLDKNNTVLSVHVVNNEVITIDGNESEQAGINFLTELEGYPLWKQTSYSGSFRKNYAGVGFIYDENRDAFIAPQPYSSWALNELTCQWEAPIPRPNDGKFYAWFEPNQAWIEVTPPNN
jgi:hypothetical protein